MTRAPRLAVIGAGLIGRRHVALVSENATLAAIVDPSEAAADVASTHGAPWFGALADALDTVDIDGAIIATPNGLHETAALACIARGIPVLIEKPITDTTEAGERIVSAATGASVPVLVGHHRRHNPLIARATEIIASGALGRLTLVNAQFWLYKPDAYYDAAWRRAPGAGPVFINLIHDIDLLRHLCGEIVSVEARQSSAARGFDVEDTAVMLLTFANGALGTVSVSDAVVAPWSWEFASGENPAYPRTHVPSIMIGGSHGTLSIPDMQLWTQPEGRDWCKPIAAETVSVAAHDPLVRQLTHFCDVIAGRVAPLVSGAEGLATLRVVEAIKTAAQTGRTVSLI